MSTDVGPTAACLLGYYIDERYAWILDPPIDFEEESAGILDHLLMFFEDPVLNIIYPCLLFRDIFIDSLAIKNVLF